jgi:protein-L-isoaspartate(D-aspartate) O-methyltransferase
MLSPTHVAPLRTVAACAVWVAAAAFPSYSMQTSSVEEGYRSRRWAMVDAQIQRRGVTDPRVLEAMRAVPRHRFVPESLRPLAYEDRPLSIGEGQTISQPFIVAYMTEALGVTGTDRVLEIGTGSGYQAAVLSRLVRDVYTIEIVPELARRAATTLEALGHANVHVREGDGYAGWPEHAPYARIIVTAAPVEVPQPLVDQLAIGGRMVIPVGDREQWLTVIEKTPRGVIERRTMSVAFVPFTRGRE